MWKLIWLVTKKLYVTIDNYINLAVAKKYHPTAYLRILILLLKCIYSNMKNVQKQWLVILLPNTINLKCKYIIFINIFINITTSKCGQGVQLMKEKTSTKVVKKNIDSP